MFRWMFFWRRKRGQGAEALKQQADVSPVNQPEQAALSEEQRNELNSQWKDTETVTVTGSNTARALGTQNVVGDSECKLVLVPPAPLSVIAPVAEGDEKKPSTAGGAADLPGNRRITYFTHGCYAVAGLGGPRLAAPGLILGAGSGRFPVRQIQPGVARGQRGGARLLPSPGQESSIG